MEKFMNRFVVVQETLSRQLTVIPRIDPLKMDRRSVLGLLQIIQSRPSSTLAKFSHWFFSATQRLSGRFACDQCERKEGNAYV